jgi:hypothetical protein
MNNSVDFALVMLYLDGVVKNQVEAAPVGKHLSEFDLRKQCARKYPVLDGLNDIYLSSFFIQALRRANRDFTFTRDGDSCFFEKIQLRDDGDNGETTVGRHDTIIYGYDAWRKEDGVESNDTAPGNSQRRRHHYQRGSDPITTAEDVVMALFKSRYVRQLDGGKVRVRDLKKVCTALRFSVDFSAVLEELQNTCDLTLENRTNKKTGKQIRYLVGLEWTSKARNIIEQE